MVTGSFGVDSTDEERFAGIDVAHAGNNFLIHDEAFDRYLAASGALIEVATDLIDGCSTNRFNTERTQKRMLLNRGRCPDEGTKASWVAKAEHHAIAEEQINVIMFFSRWVPL